MFWVAAICRQQFASTQSLCDADENRVVVFLFLVARSAFVYGQREHEIKRNDSLAWFERWWKRCFAIINCESGVHNTHVQKLPAISHTLVVVVFKSHAMLQSAYVRWFVLTLYVAVYVAKCLKHSAQTNNRSATKNYLNANNNRTYKKTNRNSVLECLSQLMRRRHLNARRTQLWRVFHPSSINRSFANIRRSLGIFFRCFSSFEKTPNKSPFYSDSIGKPLRTVLSV